MSLVYLRDVVGATEVEVVRHVTQMSHVTYQCHAKMSHVYFDVVGAIEVGVVDKLHCTHT